MSAKMQQRDQRNIKRRIYFWCVDTAAQSIRLQASDMSATFVCKISKNGSGGVDTTNPPVQVDATNKKGEFYLELTAAEIDTVGSVTVKISNTGGTKTMEPRETEVEIEPAYFATVQAGTLTAIAFTTDRAEGSGAWSDTLVRALTGSLAGQVKKVGSFTNSGGMFTLATVAGVQLAFTAAPVAGDIFEIVNK